MNVIETNTNIEILCLIYWETENFFYLNKGKCHVFHINSFKNIILPTLPHSLPLSYI